MSATAREKFERLMMGALDGELSKEERKEFNQMLAADKSLQKEFSQYKKLKQVTMDVKLASPPAEVWDNYWLGVYNRFERGIGWMVFSIGMVILMTYGGFKAVTAVINDPGLAFIVKVG
ncbi:hypothetical protein JW998_00975, partial [candidate division KSB1 bacterium]|nr:hypothetical protein [candidate division KSB1 bacterium]